MNFFHSLRMTIPSSIVAWSPKKCFRSYTLWVEIPLHNNFEYGIFLLHSCPVHYMHVNMHVGSLDLDCCFFQLAYVSFHQQLPLPGHGHQPFLWYLQWNLPGWISQLLHSAFIQHSSENLNSIVSFLLIFEAKCESCQGLHPKMPGGI